MKMKVTMAIMLLVVFLLGGYRIIQVVNKEETAQEVLTVPVSVMDVQLNEVAESLTYEGRVSPTSVEKVSFKSTARLAEFNGDVGDVIEEGTILTSLDDEDLALALEGANRQYEAAKATYQQAVNGATQEDLDLALISVEKTTEAVEYLSEQLEDIGVLLTEGVVSQSEYDGLVLEMTLAEKDLALAATNYDKAKLGSQQEVIDAAKAQMNLTLVNVKANEAMLEDSRYLASKSMVLVDQLYEIGELVPAGYPVAVLRSTTMEVNLGLTAEDLSKVYTGQSAVVETRTGTGLGTVSKVAELPDDTHFLYEVTIELAGDDYLVGDIASCALSMGNREVITVPVTAILNDGIDYVYVVEDGLAGIRQIDILKLYGEYVSVGGLIPGDQVIISNVNRLEPGSVVEIQE